MNQSGSSMQSGTRKIMITGCNGQLGRAINAIYHNHEQVECVNTDVVTGGDFGASSLDITCIREVQEFVQKERPYAIINCAAYTAVDACESHEEDAYRVNALGPQNLALAAKEVGARLFHISTDYVFEGTGVTAYIESDIPNPQSAYGRTKLAGEEFVAQVGGNYCILRTAWLYGEGKNFVLTMLRLAETMESVRVVADQMGSPTSAMELARAIAFLLEKEDAQGIYHATCEGVCSWADFAEAIFAGGHLQTKVERISSEEYVTPTKRPAFSVLENTRLGKMGYQFANWQDALKEYLLMLGK